MSDDAICRNDESRDLTIRVGLQVIGDPTEKGFLTQVATKHSDDGTSFEVANMIKYLVYL